MRTAHQRSRQLTRLAAGALIALMAATTIAACGGSAGDRSDKAAAPEQASAGRDTSAGQAAPPEGTKPGAAPVAAPTLGPTDNRSIVYKGEMTVRTPDVDESAAEASTIATGAGGVVAGDNRRAGADDSSADLVLRVPAAAFYDTVNKLAKLGKEQSRGIHTDDVTEAVVDLDTRIASQKASVDRTRALLARADRITDIVTIEGELARREAELGSMQARKRSLADQVTLSTITVHLIRPREAAPKGDPPANFLSGLGAGWDAFTTSFNVLLVVFGAMLPFLVALGVPAAAAVLLLRRRRPRPVATPAPAAAPES
jgi:hypothetical protein